MVYTKDPQEFITLNSKELMSLVGGCCYNFGVTCVEDVYQSVVLNMLRYHILERYDPNHISKNKLSSFIYFIVINTVRSLFRDDSERISRHSASVSHYMTADTDMEPADYSELAVEYQNILQRNQSTDQIDGLGFDLKCFEKFLERKGENRRYCLEKRKDTVKIHGVRLSTIYKMLRDGYSSRAIAKRYGVSDMFITYIKKDIRQALARFGIRYQRYQSRQTMSR